MRWLAALPLAGCMLWRGDDKARCPLDRTVELGVQEDVTAFAACKRASAIVVRTGAALDLSPLRQLETIAGDLVIGPTVGVDSVNLSGLRVVGGTVRIADNGLLSGVFLPLLERAGRIEIDHNAGVTTISLPRLAQVTGAVVVADNHQLELLDLTGLATVGKELAIVGHPRLTLVLARHLANAESLRLDDDPALPPEIVEQLRARAVPP
jgi:hypothetical protein